MWWLIPIVEVGLRVLAAALEPTKPRVCDRCQSDRTEKLKAKLGRWSHQCLDCNNLLDAEPTKEGA